jgi:hypothetical protein
LTGENFCEPAAAELEKISTSLKELEKSYKALLADFGEDETTDSQTFLTYIWRFVSGLEVSFFFFWSLLICREHSGCNSISRQTNDLDRRKQRKTTPGERRSRRSRRRLLRWPRPRGAKPQRRYS